jgi:hypothetical protein
MSADVEPQRPSEAVPLARELANAVRERVQSYKDVYGVSHPEAVALAGQPAPAGSDDQLLRGPPDQVCWADLENLLGRDPERALARWEEIKQAARDEARSGHRAAKRVQRWGGSPWQRAEYLALRHELQEGWQPRHGVERQLLETMAQAQTAAEYWLGVLTTRSSLAGVREMAGLQQGKGWETPRVTEAQAVEQAGAMVDRFNQMFLRTLRALRDLRRGPQPVFVQNAGQVNVGQQQVNVAAHGSVPAGIP